MRTTYRDQDVIRRTKRAAAANTVHVGGPWCPWPRDAWDGTCIWPHQRGPMPREWWIEHWKRTGHPEVAQRMEAGR